MGNQITFYFFISQHRRIKRITVSKSLLSAICLMMIMYCACLGYFGWDYFRLKQRALNADTIKDRLAGQDQTIIRQKRQLNNFIQDINSLKHKLLALNAFETKLRIVADLDAPLHGESRFGIGGSVPEDLNPVLAHGRDHHLFDEKMQNQIEYLHASCEDQHDRFETLLDGIERKLTLLASTPSIRPTRGYLSSGFGYRASPFTGEREFHRGLDFAARTGTPVIAPADGMVTFAGRKGILGRVIVIDHGHGMVTRYGHLQKILAHPGNRVKRGDEIARVGSSGRSTGPHLHYEVRFGGIPVNPMKYILN